MKTTVKTRPNARCMKKGHAFRRAEDIDDLKRARPLFGWRCKECDLSIWSIVNKRPVR